MSEQVSVEVGAGGGPVAVKRAHDEPGRERLRREAEVLELARHQGVVELVSLDDGDDVTSLSTAWLGGGTIAASQPPPRRLAAMGAQLARTIADLHERGIVHSRVTVDHVLLDGLGRVVLAGFADATTARELPGADTADDVAGLAQVLLAKLPQALPGTLPRLRTTSADREIVDRLRSVAERGADADPTRRPGARALATLLAEIAGEPVAAGPRPLGRPGPSRDASTHPLEPAYDAARELVSRMPRAKVIGVCAVVATIVVVGVGARVATARGGATTIDSESSPPSTTAASTALHRGEPAVTSARVWPTSTACAELLGGGERHDVDGDGCSELVSVTPGAIVVGERRYQIGESGESVAVSDWDCDGRATPAVLRPGTGEIFVFDTWATTGAPATARLLQAVPGATSLRRSDERCGVITVVDSSGAPVTIEVGA